MLIVPDVSHYPYIPPLNVCIVSKYVCTKFLELLDPGVAFTTTSKFGFDAKTDTVKDAAQKQKLTCLMH